MTRKLRPYDEPPKRRRSLIPNAPDSAAGLFLVVAILWLLAAAGIGMLAAAERLFPDVLKVAFNVPFGSGIGVEITRTSDTIRRGGYAGVAVRPRVTMIVRFSLDGRRIIQIGYQFSTPLPTFADCLF